MGETALPPLGEISEEMAHHKGYGYAIVIEVLSAAPAAGNFLHQLTCMDEQGRKVPYHLGHFFIVINSEAIMAFETFKKMTGDILRLPLASGSVAKNGQLLKRKAKLALKGNKTLLQRRRESKRGILGVWQDCNFAVFAVFAAIFRVQGCSAKLEEDRKDSIGQKVNAVELSTGNIYEW